MRIHRELHNRIKDGVPYNPKDKFIRELANSIVVYYQGRSGDPGKKALQYIRRKMQSILTHKKRGRPREHSTAAVRARSRGVRGPCDRSLYRKRKQFEDSAAHSDRDRVVAAQFAQASSQIPEFDIIGIADRMQRRMNNGSSLFGYKTGVLHMVGKNKNYRCHGCNGYLGKHQGFVHCIVCFNAMQQSSLCVTERCVVFASVVIHIR